MSNLYGSVEIELIGKKRREVYYPKNSMERSKDSGQFSKELKDEIEYISTHGVWLSGFEYLPPSRIERIYLFD